MSLFSWQCQNLCLLILAFIRDWRVVAIIWIQYVLHNFRQNLEIYDSKYDLNWEGKEGVFNDDFLAALPTGMKGIFGHPSTAVMLKGCCCCSFSFPRRFLEWFSFCGSKSSVSSNTPDVIMIAQLCGKSELSPADKEGNPLS